MADVLAALVGLGAVAAGVSSQGGQLLALLAGIVALAGLALGFIGFTVARLSGTSRLPGIVAMAFAAAVLAALIAAAVTS
jgi:hypothetical protein